MVGLGLPEEIGKSNRKTAEMPSAISHLGSLREGQDLARGDHPNF